MRRYTVVSLLLAIMLILSGCSEEESTESTTTTSVTTPVTTPATASVEGAAQKGPLLKGSIVEVHKIEDNGSIGDLIKTVSITDNNGTYKIDLNTSGLVLIKIKGKYFNELNGTISDKEVELENILEIREGEKKQANTNILTDLTAKRTLTLLQSNNSNNIAEAFEEAKTDIAKIFEDVGIDQNISFEELDIEKNTELLKISVAFADVTKLNELKNVVTTSDENNITEINVTNIAGQNITEINTSEISENLNEFQGDQAPVINWLKYNGNEIGNILEVDEDNGNISIEINATDEDDNLTVEVYISQNDNIVDGNISGQNISIDTDDNTSFTLYIDPYSCDDGNNSFILRTIPDKYSDVNITVVVSDGMKVDVKEFTLKVNPVNDVPVIHSLEYNNTNISNSVISRDEDFAPFVIDVNATDVDSENLTLDVIANPQIVNIEQNVSNMSFTISSMPNYNGDVNITVIVSDGELEANQTFTLTINSVNDAPSIDSINFNGNPIAGNISVVEGSGFIVIDLNISDVDDTNLTINVNDSAGLTSPAIDGTTVTLAPNDDPTGETTITITVSDGNLSTTESFTLEIYPQLNGKVVDGYVKNAKIEIFDNNTYTNTNLIGQGFTDSNGSFTINLNTANLPDLVYIKSTGGVIINNGMPAPTMLFVGNKNSNGEYIITPITNIIAEKEKSGLDINQTITQLATDLNLTEDDLFINPETNTTIKNVLKQKVLPASTFASNLADGNYTAYIIFFDKDSIEDNKTITSVGDIEQNILPISINISDGNISGSFNDDGEYHTIRGYVSGTTVLMEVILQDSYVSLAGTVGLYGSVSGVAATFCNSCIIPGVFVGQFVPQDINSSQIDQMILDTNNMIVGKENLLFRLNIGSTGMVIGSIFVNDINESRSLTLLDINVTDEANNTFTLTADNNESKLLSVNGFPTNIAVMKYVVDDNTTAYFIQPVGLRKGIIITTDNNKVDEIGDAYITKSDTISPALKAGTYYTMRVGFVHAGMLGMDRGNILPFLSIAEDINTSDIDTSEVGTYLREPTRIELGNEVIFFNDSVIGMYADVDGGDINSTADYMRTLQIYNSGAFDGEHISGGNLLNTTELLQDYPGFFVGYLKEQNSDTTVSPDGEYNLIARSLYFQNTTPTLVRGKLIINGNSATLEIFDENGSFSLNIACADGLCHIDGDVSDGDYVDIVWPIGGKKGLYVVSDSESGQVFEVGEAYISQ